MGNRLIRIPEVMSLTGLGKSTVWLWTKKGIFPKPKKLSPRVSVWNESDILEFTKNPEYFIENMPFRDSPDNKHKDIQ